MDLEVTRFILSYGSITNLEKLENRLMLLW